MDLIGGENVGPLLKSVAVRMKRYAMRESIQQFYASSTISLPFLAILEVGRW